jgi:ATP phosphoribosyltransferase
MGNNTFDCLGDTGSELELTDFQEKNRQPKSLILLSDLPFGQSGLVIASIPAPHWTTSDNLPKRQHIPLRRTCAQTP